MQPDIMATLASSLQAGPLHASSPGPELSTQHGGREPFSERFRRAKLREQMFGAAGDELRIGRFRIIDRIGAGAMGVVYLGLDEKLEREVAVKLLAIDDPVGRERMLREARALAKLSHPNVVTVHEVGTHEGQVFVAMEFVDGITLSQWLADRPSPAAVLDVFCQAAMGLQAAHDAGIVHRDFKPDNVLVGNDGRVRVLDFGLAQPPGASLPSEVADASVASDLTKPTLTRTGMFAGTPAYMAPEQFAGTPVDARADQFAFCIALHEALHGRRPFSGESLRELAHHVIAGEAALETTRGQGSHVDAVIERGLCTSPSDRFPSMSAVVLELRRTSSEVPRALVWVIGGLFGFFVLSMLGGVAVYLLAAPKEEPSVTVVDVAQPPEPPPPPEPEPVWAGLSREDRSAIFTHAYETYDAGVRARDAGDYVRAIALFDEAQSIGARIDRNDPKFRDALQTVLELAHGETGDVGYLHRLVTYHDERIKNASRMGHATPLEESSAELARLLPLLGKPENVDFRGPSDEEIQLRFHTVRPGQVFDHQTGQRIGETNQILTLPGGQEGRTFRIEMPGCEPEPRWFPFFGVKENRVLCERDSRHRR